MVDSFELKRKEILAPFAEDPAGPRMQALGWQRAEFIYVGYKMQEVRNYGTLMLRPPANTTRSFLLIHNSRF
jgi:hypothetical protein